ncbi:hypothetical protein [Segniliparus rotundus]|uniref:hypothetical protein n=1 Tax=Segniliparus rotundus TaxID=286802 RepID=UPI00059D6775|nr:hypothetical protein [Segniliparus rotundus]
MSSLRLSCAASSVCRSEEFDLGAFLERIGHTPNAEPTLSTPRPLQSAYATSVPWKNVDMFLGRLATLSKPGRSSTGSRPGAEV